MDTFAKRLREERQRLGMSQTEFSLLGGSSKPSQARYEKGDRSPDADYLAAISKVGVDIQFLICGERTNFPSLQKIAISASKLINAMAGQDFEPIPRYDVFLAAGNGVLNPLCQGSCPLVFFSSISQMGGIG